MKKVLAVAVISLGLTLPATAQFTQGKILATGGLNFSSGSVNEEEPDTNYTAMSEMGFGINLGAGYFFADNMAAGVRLGYNSSSTTFDPDASTPTTLSSNSFEWGIFGRYYMPYNERFAMFGELGFSMMSSSSESETGSITVAGPSGSGMSVGVGIGMNYMVHDMIGLEMSYGFLGYNSVSMTQDIGGGDEEVTTTSSFGLMGDLSSVNLGVIILL